MSPSVGWNLTKRSNNLHVWCIAASGHEIFSCMRWWKINSRTSAALWGKPLKWSSVHTDSVCVELQVSQLSNPAVRTVKTLSPVTYLASFLWRHLTFFTFCYFIMTVTLSPLLFRPRVVDNKLTFLAQINNIYIKGNALQTIVYSLECVNEQIAIVIFDKQITHGLAMNFDLML